VSTAGACHPADSIGFPQKAFRTTAPVGFAQGTIAATGVFAAFVTKSRASHEVSAIYVRNSYLLFVEMWEGRISNTGLARLTGRNGPFK
jgi:hypothetical protein